MLLLFREKMFRLAFLNRLLLLASLFCILVPTQALGNWTLNLGYHNPPNATVGVNFLYFKSSWAFELGIGWLDGDIESEDDSDENSQNQNEENNVKASAAGALNFKKFFSGGSVRPYLQIGVGAGVGIQAGDSGGFGAGVGGVYGGGGIFIGDPTFYLYASYNLSSQSTFAQLGFGFDI